MNRKKLLGRIARGDRHNIAFRDFVNLAAGFGFVLDHISGSHHVLLLPGRRVRLVVQPIHGKAKPYQLGQLLRAVEEHKLVLEE